MSERRLASPLLAADRPALGVAGALPAALATALLLIVLLPHGIGFAPDSAHYLSAALNIRAGHGFATSIVAWDSPGETQPLATWPPLYALALAAPLFAAPDRVAHTLNLLLFGANTLLVTWMVYGRTCRRLRALLAGAAMALSPAMLFVHGYALSEPLFIHLALLGLIFQDSYRRSQSYRHVLLAALAGAAAALTRYAGISLLFAGVLAIGLNTAGSWRRRWIAASLYAALSGLPLAFWLLRNYLATGTLAGIRTASGYGVGALARDLATTFGSWFVPFFAPPLLSFVAGLGLLAYLLGAWRFRRSDPALIGLVSYTLYLAATSLLVAMDQVDSRLLAPLFPIVVVALLGQRSRISGGQLLKKVGERGNWRGAAPLQTTPHPGVSAALRRLGLAGALVVLLVAPALNAARDAAYGAFRTDGYGYRSARWREADIVEALRAGMPELAGATVYSNAADVLFLYSGRGARYLPPAAAAPGDLAEAIAPAGAVVFVHRNDTRAGLLPEVAFQHSPAFRLAKRFRDGAIYAPIQEGLR